jgi:putative ABC transport system ATP-binding protein
MTSNGNGSALISLRGVNKVFFTDEVETHALDDVHFDINQGEYVAISGPSGCGKTTLLSILGLLDTPTEGEYTLAGESVARLAPVDRARVRNRQIGFIFQAFNLMPSLTVTQNIGLPLRLDGRRPRRADVREVAARVGLDDRLRHRPAQLSGGQQQRVAIARALVTRPEVVFADEPTGALDTRTGRGVLALLREVVDRDGHTVVMVTHDPVAASHADRVLLLADGRIVGMLDAPSPDEVAEQLAHLGD